MIRLFSIVPMITLFALSESTLISKLAAIIIFLFLVLFIYGEGR